MSPAAENPAPERETDAALVARIAGGERDAFKCLYERYAPAVLAFLASRLGDHALAEDALQEAFCKAHGALASYDAKRPFGPWIATIAENVARDDYRARRRTKTGFAGDEKLVPDGEVVRIVARREREEVVRAALTALAPEPRRVLLLRYQRGLTQREVSLELGCSLRTAQTREQEALEMLQRLLDERRRTADKERAP